MPSPSHQIVALGELLWDLLPTGPRAGGAPFNFAFHCHQLGHPAVIVSRVGDDELGRQLKEEVRRLGLSDEYIQTDREHPTGTVQVTVDAVGQPTYIIAEQVAWDFIELNRQLERLAAKGGIACYGTLAQRHAVSRRTIRDYLRRIRPTGMTVCDINLRPPFASRQVVATAVESAGWLKLNASEVSEVLSAIDGGWDDLAVLGEEFADDSLEATRLLMLAATNVSLVCVTHGADGCLVRTLGEAVDLPGIPVRVVDTIGAGDAFTAALLTESLAGKSLTQAVRFANAYAAVVASKVGGTPTVTRAEVESLL